MRDTSRNVIIESNATSRTRSTSHFTLLFSCFYIDLTRN